MHKGFEVRKSSGIAAASAESSPSFGLFFLRFSISFFLIRDWGVVVGGSPIGVFISPPKIFSGRARAY